MATLRDRLRTMTRPIQLGLAAYIPIALPAVGYFLVRSGAPFDKFYVLFAIPYAAGIVLTLTMLIIVAQVFRLDFKRWTSQDRRALAFIVFFISLFIGYMLYQSNRHALTNALFHVKGVWFPARSRVTDAYETILFICMVGAILYVAYRITDYILIRRTKSITFISPLKQNLFLTVKLLLWGSAILALALLIRGIDGVHALQLAALDLPGYALESNPDVSIVRLNSAGLGHAAYLKAIYQISRDLRAHGAAAVIAPLPRGLESSASHVEQVKMISQLGRIVFAVPPSPEEYYPRFLVRNPVDNKVSIRYGVIGIVRLPRLRWTITEYHPYSYFDKLGIVSDAAVLAVQTARGMSADTIRIEEEDFVFGDFRTGLTKDGRAIARNKVLSFDFLYAMMGENSDSVQYSDSPAFLWQEQIPTGGKLPSAFYDGKIVVIDPGEEVTELRSFDLGFYYSNIIFQLLHKDSTKPLDRLTALVTSLALLLTFALLKFPSRWLRWPLALGFVIGQVLLIQWLFARFGLVIESFSPLIATGLGFFAFSIVLYADERTRLERGERKRIHEELIAARTMQLGLMPTHDPEVRGFDIAGICVPAQEVGGDFYDYVWVDKRKTKLGITVADVSGKAMKAAMTAVLTSGILYSEAGKSQSPREILTQINRPLYLRTDKRVFTTMAFAVIDLRKRTMVYSSAGHLPPLIARKGSLRYLKTESTGLPLGVKEELLYQEEKIKLQRGDTIVLYTDGIPEAMNEQKDQYGSGRLETVVKSNVLGTAKDLREKILADVFAFTSTAEQHDDMTVVVVKVL